MIYQKIFFLVILVFTGAILISSQLQSTENISILVNDSGPFIGTSIPYQSGYDGSGIIISIIDTGIDLNHPDLDGQIIGGYDFVDNDDMPEDINGHGTQVAGIIASNGNLKGIAPNSKILMYKVSEDGESVPSNLIIKAIEKSGFKPGEEVSICLDVAANELNEKKTIDYYYELTKKYPIKSIEDPFAEDDWMSWIRFMKFIKVNNKNIQIVGDDLFVTNKERLSKGIKEQSANAILVKPNQIGTLTETIDVIKLAHKNNYKTIISHRSGDSEDTFIADLAVATGSSQIKTGSLSRSDRLAKYNRLLRIEEELGDDAFYPGINAFKHL